MPTVSSCSRVEWTTEKINGDARRFYNSLGFSVNNGKVWYCVETRPDPTVQPSYQSCAPTPRGTRPCGRPVARRDADWSRHPSGLTA